MRKFLILSAGFVLFFLSTILSTKLVRAEYCPKPPCYTTAECSLSDCRSCSMCQPATNDCPTECQRGQLSCDFSACQNCSFCKDTNRDFDSDKSSEEPTESIEGKIFNPVLPNRLSTLPGSAFLGKFLRSSVSLILTLGIIIFFFIFVTGGIKWLSSSGDKAKLEGAQKQLSSGLTGLVILLSAFAIIQLIEKLFGISLLQITLPTL